MSASLRVLVVFAAWAAALAWASPARAAEPTVVSLPDLVAQAGELDGATVSVQGEAIGEALRADDGRTVWVNLLEDGTAVGVWMPREMAAKIERWGGYRQTGDTVRVTGVVNLACDRHGGDLDVHASRIEAIAPGAPREESVRPFEAVVGALGFVVAAASALLARARERRTPKEG